MITRATPTSSSIRLRLMSARRAALLRAGQTPLEPQPRHGDRQAARQIRATPLYYGWAAASEFLPPSGNKLLNCADDITRLATAVAPAGRGPVISSLDGVVDYSAAAPAATAGPRFDPVKPLVESVTWCVHNEACTIVLEAAAEVVAQEAVAVAAEATVSWLVVIGGGIVLGLVFFVLYEILFPTPIAFAGLIEYPIHFNTNFDTFDNWGGQKGKWIDSLKIFAEMIKTANQVAGKNNIPFGWDALKEHQLKNIIDSACTAQQGAPVGASAGCGNGFAVHVPGAVNYRFRPMPQTGAHIVNAMSNGSGGFPTPDRVKWFYPARSVDGQAAKSPPHNFRPGWYDTAAFNPPVMSNPCNGRPPALPVCDEFPFWTTNQAVNLSGTLADLEPVPGTESSPQGSDLSGFYRKCKVDDGDRFLILPVKPWVDAGGPSFGFRVDQGGTRSVGQ